MNISKMLANSVKKYGEEFVAEQIALRSEQSRPKSLLLIMRLHKRKS